MKFAIRSGKAQSHCSTGLSIITIGRNNLLRLDSLSVARCLDEALATRETGSNRKQGIVPIAENFAGSN
eukprot:scaffold291965_cov16-Prasinocladus_malaysianus.AAC.1